MSRRWNCITLIFLLASGVAMGSVEPPKAKRMKTIDFEDELVEGMNKRPLDSLTYLGEKDKDRKKPHLYRKRAGFRGETMLTLRRLRYQ